MIIWTNRTPPTISCAFPLAGDVTPTGASQLTMSNSDRTGSVVIATTGTWAAAPDGFLTGDSQQYDTTTGIRTIGLSVDSLTMAAIGEGAISLSLSCRSVDFSSIPLSIGVASIGGDYLVESIVDGVTTESISLGVSPPDAIYMATDSANSTVYFAYLTGSTLTQMADQPYTPQMVVPTIIADASTPSGSIIGDSITGTFLSVSTDLESLIAGATDNCGNPIA